MRRLIINADDFGLTSGVNRAILKAHSNGIVTSATLMANARAFEDAVQQSKAADQLGVGCHVVLVDGTPVLAREQVRTLLNEVGCFRKSAGSVGLAAWAGRVDPGQISAEATAQIRRLLDAGVRVSHVDTHKHVHMFPEVLAGVIAAAKACGVSAIRNPFEPVRLAQFVSGSRKRWLQVKALGILASRFRRIVKQSGMVTPDGSLGVVATGVLNQASFRDLMEHCPEGTWELVCHPGYVDGDLANAGTRLQQSRAIELELLTSPEARTMVEKAGIELISYRQLL